MAFVAVLINVAALIVGGGHPVTIISLIVSIYAYGVARNFARPYDPSSIPTFILYLTLGSGITGIIRLIIGIVG
jgi:hypothetical protein